MTVPERDNIEQWLQNRMRLFSADDLPLTYFSSSIIAGAQYDNLERWQLAVDMIYRCIVSGLLELTYPKYRTDHDAFFQAIRTRSPFDPGPPFDDSGAVLWNVEQLYGTDKLIGLVDKYFPNTGNAYDETVNPAFVEELRDVFAAAGVPWSDAPLLPVAAK